MGRQRLANLLGRSTNAIARWERGESIPYDFNTVAGLAEVLQLDLDRLIQLTGVGDERRLPMPATPPVGEPSYLEVPSEKARYQTRTLVTAVVLLAFVFLLVWAGRELWHALVAAWQSLV